MNQSCRTELYRHFDEAGELLYVGISYSALVRLYGHRTTSEWFDKIATIKVERFETRELAEAAELEAIKNENPKYNRKGITDSRQRAVDASITNLIESITFKPAYTPEEVRTLLGFPKYIVSDAVAKGELRSFTVEIKYKGVLKPRIYVTGWAVIEWLYMLERKQ